jgi:hypothetical protein
MAPVTILRSRIVAGEQFLMAPAGRIAGDLVTMKKPRTVAQG